MENNSLTIATGDFHYIQSIFWQYNAEYELKNVKITQNGFTFSLLQLNRLFTQMSELYQKLQFELKVGRDAELLLHYCKIVSKKIVQANRELAQIRASK